MSDDITKRLVEQAKRSMDPRLASAAIDGAASIVVLRAEIERLRARLAKAREEAETVREEWREASIGGHYDVDHDMLRVLAALDDDTAADDGERGRWTGYPAGTPIVDDPALYPERARRTIEAQAAEIERLRARLAITGRAARHRGHLVERLAERWTMAEVLDLERALDDDATAGDAATE